MSHDLQEDRSGRGGGRWSGSLIGCLLLGLFLGSAAALLYCFQLIARSTAAISERIDEAPLAESAALDFLTDLKTGRIEAAYERTTERFRRQWSLKQFRSFLAGHPALEESTGRVDHFESDNGRTILHATFSFKEQEVSCTVEAVKQDQLWRVDQFRIP